MCRICLIYLSKCLKVFILPSDFTNTVTYVLFTFQPYTLYPKPYTLHLTPYTLIYFFPIPRFSIIPPLVFFVPDHYPIFGVDMFPQL